MCESLEPYGPPPSFTILKYTVQYNNLIAKERIGRRGVHYRLGNSIQVNLEILRQIYFTRFLCFKPFAPTLSS